MRNYAWSNLEALFLAGERCDPPTAVWAAGMLGKPVVDHWWQTETGWPITAGFREFGLFPPKPRTGGPPAAAARLRADPVAERRGLSHRLPGRFPRLVSLRRCRDGGCGWRRFG